jgi:phenol/toluene 2-monooxygenase (NADH) P0/A0
MGQEDKPHLPHKFVRVTGCRGKDLIEFDFAVGSPDLFVELILPEAALAEFCRSNEVIVLPSGDDTQAHDALHWRLRDVTPGPIEPRD